MGITIHFEGHTTSKRKMGQLIVEAKQYSSNLGWSYKEVEDNGLIIFPHEKCETLSLQFNEKLRIQGFMKTEYAPADIHRHIIDLFINLRPYFKSIHIHEDTGYWEERTEINDKLDFQLKVDDIPAKYLDEVMQYEGFKACEEEEWFWTTDHPYSLFHLPTIVQFMGRELSTDRNESVSLARIFNELNVSNRISTRVDPAFPELVFIDLARTWARRSLRGKLTKSKELACDELAWTIANASYGFHGGFLSKRHRKALNIVEGLRGRKLDPRHSIQYLLAFCRLFDLNCYKGE